MTVKNSELKSGFVLYFDSYPALSALSMEQRGILLTVLFVYGDRLRRQVEEPLEELMEQFPQLDQGTRGVLLMMGAHMARDHAKWVRRVEARRLAKGQQSAPVPPPVKGKPARAQGDRSGPVPSAAAQPGSAYESTRQLMERWKAQEGES